MQLCNLDCRFYCDIHKCTTTCLSTIANLWLTVGVGKSIDIHGNPHFQQLMGCAVDLPSLPNFHSKFTCGCISSSLPMQQPGYNTCIMISLLAECSVCAHISSAMKRLYKVRNILLQFTSAALLFLKIQLAASKIGLENQIQSKASKYIQRIGRCQK